LKIEVSLNVLRKAVGSLGEDEGFVGESRVCLERLTIMFCLELDIEVLWGSIGHIERVECN